jgi:hypothetical protein
MLKGAPPNHLACPWLVLGIRVAWGWLAVGLHKHSQYGEGHLAPTCHPRGKPVFAKTYGFWQ